MLIRICDTLQKSEDNLSIWAEDQEADNEKSKYVIMILCNEKKYTIESIKYRLF